MKTDITNGYLSHYGEGKNYNNEKAPCHYEHRMARLKLGMVANTCNPRYLEGRSQEDSNLLPAWQKVSETPISANMLSVVVHTCNTSYEGGIGRKIMV
jgi:hypothetical protein